MKREKTKHKGIYKVGENYYVIYNTGKKVVLENGDVYCERREKRIEGNLDEALKFKVEMKEKVKHGKYSVIEKMEKMTFRDLMNLYKEKGERKAYVLKFEKEYLDYFGDRKLSSISRVNLFDFKNKVKETPKQHGGGEVKGSTVNRALAGLRKLFNFGISMQCLEESPFPSEPKSSLYFSEKKGLRNFFDERQLVQIIAASPGWLKPIILTLYLTGMRTGEALRLRWDHINFETGIIYLPSSKTLKDDTGLGQKIVMQRELIDLFQSLRKHGEWVFTNWNGLPYNHWDVYKPFKAVLKSLGIDDKKYSLKEIRHTTGSLMNLKGVSPMAIKDQLRHASIKTTDEYYIGSDTEFQRAQAEKLVFNDLPLS
jgi:integrase